MKVGAITESRLKLAAALGVGVGLLVVPFFYRVQVVHGNLTGFSFVAVAAGFLAWIVGELFQPKGIEERLEQPGRAKTAAELSLTVLRGLKYWGLTLILATGSLSAFEVIRHHKPIRFHKPALAALAPGKVKAKAEVKPNFQPEVKSEVKPEVKPVVNHEVPVVFPPLQLKGLSLNGAKSSALINGHVVLVGERIDEVMLLAVEDDRVTVGLGGQTKVLKIRK